MGLPLQDLIKFCHNWNGKLDLDVFTTIQGWSDAKEKYYNSKIGQPFDLVFKGRPARPVKLLDVEVMELHRVPRALLMADTGIQDKTKIFELFKRFGIAYDGKAIILTFGRYE